MIIYRRGTKQTRKIVNRRLRALGRPERMVGPYTNSKTATEIRSFSCTHVWKTSADILLNSESGCPYCSGKIKSKELVNAQLIENNRPERILGEYYGATSKTLFGSIKCSHIWSAMPNNVLNNKTGCPQCRKLDKTTINLRLSQNNSNFIMIGEFRSTREKTLFKSLDCGHEWEATPSNALRYGGCVLCQRTSGFRTKLPAWGYVLVGETSDSIKYIKYGVTNYFDQRIAFHLKINNTYKIVHQFYSLNGQTVLAWEKYIKKELGGNYLSREQCKEGWTETLPIYLLETVVATLETS